MNNCNITQLVFTSLQAITEIVLSHSCHDFLISFPVRTAPLMVRLCLNDKKEMKQIIPISDLNAFPTVGVWTGLAVVLLTRNYSLFHQGVTGQGETDFRIYQQSAKQNKTKEWNCSANNGAARQSFISCQPPAAAQLMMKASAQLSETMRSPSTSVHSE